MPRDRGPDPIQEAKPKDAKYCTHCGILKSFDLFSKDNTKEDGLSSICAPCRREVDREQRKSQDARLASVDEEGFQILETLQSGGSYDPHVNEVFEAVLRPFGGVNGWAKHLFATYLASPPGSTRRIKVHDMIMQLAGKVTKLGLAERQLDMMEERDLLNVMREHLKDYQDSNDLPSTALPSPRGGVIDVAEFESVEQQGE